MVNISAILNQLRAQRGQLQKELERLDSAITALNSLTTHNHRGKTGNASTTRRPLSAAARKKIAAAQRARWAAWKAKQKHAA